ncbi:MAG: DNA cytosine methyltransferase [Planctomycetota bacterium]
MPTAATSRTPLRYAEFFAGIGLVRMGLERSSSRWSCEFANDLDPVKRDIYAAHFGEPVESIDGSDVHDLPGDSVGNIDLATASFPCTDLSLAGGRGGIRSGESSAFWGFHRVLEEMGERRPPMVMLENVVGFLSSNGGNDFRDAMLAMNELGYRVDPFVLDARWFTPQSRPRMFIVCTSDELADDGAGGLVAESRIRPHKLAAFVHRHSGEIRWNIRDLPEPPLESPRKLKDIVQQLRPGHPDWWKEDRVEYLLGQMFDRHLAWIDANRDQSRYQYATAFRRVRPIGGGEKKSMAELRTDGIAGCLRTPKGGSGRQILVRAGRGTVAARLLSGPECASLMGADGYTMAGTLNQMLFGFGDAVCVDAVSWIAQHYIEPVLAKAAAAVAV